MKIVEVKFTFIIKHELPFIYKFNKIHQKKKKLKTFSLNLIIIYILNGEIHLEFLIQTGDI